MNFTFVQALPLTRERHASLPLKCNLRRVRILQLAPRIGVVTMAKNNESSGTGLGLRLVAAALVAGIIATALSPLATGFQSIRNDDPVAAVSSTTTMSSTSVGEKLRRVPVFAVTDETGRPYLSESNDKKFRTGYFFMDPSDAELFLNKVRETTTDEESKLARVRTLTLEDAIPFVGRKRPSGIKGVPEKFQLVPDEKQTKIANDITNGKFQLTFADGVPLFYVENLALRAKEQTEAFIPVFFEKQTLDEYLKKAREAGGVPETPIQVIDLLQTIRELKAGRNERLKQVQLYPLENAISYTAREKALAKAMGSDSVSE